MISLSEWLADRHDAAKRFATATTGKDRLEWLEHASYFLRAQQAVLHLEAACDGDNHPLRMYIALRILRAWNSGTAGYDARTVHVMNEWIDGGMKGPVPWPDGAFFDAWAKENGFQKVGEYVGFRFVATMPAQAPGGLHV